MFHTYFAPQPALLEYIDSVFVLNIDFTAGTGLSPIYPFVPTHNRFLCFYLQDQVQVKKQPHEEFITRARSIIIGPQLTPVTLNLGKHYQAVVVNLKPAGMYRLLGIPMAELVDCDYDARLLMGRGIDELLDRLQESRSDPARNDIIRRYLLGKLHQLKPILPFDLAILYQVQASGNLAIEHVAGQACLSLRQFERKSYERLGLPPKVYSRMIRFSHAYKYKESSPHTSWTEIAYRCGYFDQMHFIRDFKFFAGVTPSMLIRSGNREISPLSHHGRPVYFFLAARYRADNVAFVLGTWFFTPVHLRKIQARAPASTAAPLPPKKRHTEPVRHRNCTVPMI